MRLVRASVALVVAGLVVGLVGAPAGAVVPVGERAEGLWYADALKFDEIAAMGLTGEGITIAVIDDAINLDAPELQDADIEVRGQFCRDKATGDEMPAVTDDPERGHGTDVVSMLVGNGVAADGGPGTRGIVPDAKILFYASDNLPGEGRELRCEAYNPVTGEFESEREEDYTPEDLATGTVGTPQAVAARQALADGADIINVSSVGSLDTVNDWTAPVVEALRSGIPVIAGTENPPPNYETNDTMPAQLNGVVAVGGVDSDAEPIRGLDQFGDQVTAMGTPNMGFSAPGYQILTPSGDGEWGPSFGYGTSLATPLVAGTLALGLERFPDATANQVLQSMIRTTGGELGDPQWFDDLYGYGTISPVTMLSDDPAQYPDENPLFLASVEDPRCGPDAYVDEVSYKGCAWASDPTMSQVQLPEDEEPTSPNGESAFAGVVPVLIGAGVVVLVLVVATAVVVPVLVLRSRKRRAAEAQAQQLLEHQVGAAAPPVQQQYLDGPGS